VSDAFDIAARGVSKSFGGRKVLDGVRLDVRRGEFFSLLGPSGCGKSTLLRVFAGFERPDEGDVELAGRDMRDVPPQRRDCNMVFQNYALFPHLDVAGNVGFGLERPDPARVAECLSLVNLSGSERRSVSTLSGGEQQRVAIARALAPRPRVLLLDEPLGALDLQLRKGLREELRRLQRSLGLTFLMVTHDQEEALACSDRLAVMNQGRLEQVGTPREIYEGPASRFVAGFVGAANFLDEGMVRPEKIRVGDEGLPALVEDVLYQGAVVHAVLRAGERRIVAEGIFDVRPGQRVHVSWRPEDVRTFPR